MGVEIFFHIRSAGYQNEDERMHGLISEYVIGGGGGIYPTPDPYGIKKFPVPRG